jgi:general stress protein 26
MVHTAETPLEQQHKLREIIEHARTAMMVTLTPEGAMHARPMATASLEEAGLDRLYFATQAESGKVHDIAFDARVCLTYSGDARWASITGWARVIDNRPLVDRLWSPFWRNWFDNADDPNLLLIEVAPDEGTYWDAGSKFTAFIKMATAAATGHHFDTGEVKQVKL